MEITTPELHEIIKKGSNARFVAEHGTEKSLKYLAYNWAAWHIGGIAMLFVTMTTCIWALVATIMLLIATSKIDVHYKFGNTVAHNLRIWTQ